MPLGRARRAFKCESMRRAFALLGLLLLAGCITPTSDPLDLPAGEWRLDPHHSSAVWRVRHLGTGWTVGRFDQLDASLTFDPDRPDASRLTAIIETASVSTADSEFDSVLESAPWLAADANPQIVFQAVRVEVTGERTGVAEGELTLRGVTRPARMEIEFHGGVRNPLEGRRMIAFGGDLRVDRDAFNVGNLPHAIVGETVHIRIEAEFLREGEVQ